MHEAVNWLFIYLKHGFSLEIEIPSTLVVCRTMSLENGTININSFDKEA